MKSLIIRLLNDYFASVFKKIKEDPMRNISILSFSIVVIYFMLNAILPFGFITTISYLIACIRGLTKIVDDPYRPLLWSIGFVFSAVMIKILVNRLVPNFNEITLISLISVLLIVYMVTPILLKLREFKNY